MPELLVSKNLVTRKGHPANAVQIANELISLASDFKKKAETKPEKPPKPKGKTEGRKRLFDVPEGAMRRDEVEALFGVTSMSISKWIDAGKLTNHGTNRKQWFWRDEVEKLKKERDQ